MLRFINSFFPRYARSWGKEVPAIQGNLRLELRDGGKLAGVREGSNIWTLTGREFLAELMALQAHSPRTTFREDRVAYIGLGTGAQPEVSNIESLVEPTVYATGEFLAPLGVPATIVSGTGVQFVREFARTEVSLGYNVVLSEAGLFTDGDPANGDAIPAPTSYGSAASRAPVAYKTYEPITKTTRFSLRAVWEVRIV